jgi:hypothetical protein
MPQAALAAAGADRVVALRDVGAAITELLARGRQGGGNGSHARASGK